MEFDSSDFDADDGSGCVMVGAESRVLMSGVEVDVFRDEALEPDTIRARASGATLRVTILVFREPLGVALAGVAMMEDECIVDRYGEVDMGRGSDGGWSGEANTQARRGGRVLRRPSGGYIGVGWNVARCSACCQAASLDVRRRDGRWW